MAIKYLAGNRITGTNSDRTGLASGVTDYLNDGTLWLELVTNDMYKWDKAADAWELVTGNTVAESFSNKTFADALTLTEISAPGTPSSGTFVIYPKSDNKLYGKNDGGTEYDLTVGTGATSLGALSDITLGGVTLAAGHILIYDGSSVFLNKLVSGATGTTATLSAAGALDITALTVLTDLDLTAGNKTIFDTVGANTITFAASGTQTTFPGNVTVSGNFTVSGTTTTVSTTNTIIADHLLELNTGAGSNADDAGIIIERGSTGNNAIFVWDESEDGFIVGTTTATADATSNITIAAAPFQASAITGTTGTFTGLLTTNSKLLIDTANSALTLSADGQLLHIDALTFTDGTTSSGTAAQNYSSVNLDQTTLAATASSITTTRAATLNIVGAPVAGTNMTLTNSYALYVAGGASHFVGAVTAASTMAVTGNSTFAGTLGITGAVTASAAMTVGTTLGVTGVLTTTTHTAVGGNLTVTGTSGFTGAVTLPSGTAITAPNITGGTAIELTQLSVRDNSAAYDLEFQSATTSMGADRLLIFNVNNADRTIALAGNVTTAGAFTTSGANALTLTTTGATNVTLPTTGTLSAIGGTETFTNKTLTSPVINTPTVGTTLSLLEDAVIIFEGATNNANETTLTVVDPTGDRVVSLPDATDTLVGKATTDTLTNKTLTAPKFADGGFIADAAGLQLIIFDSVASSVNEFTVLNAATGNGSSTGTPTLSVTGGDTNIALTLKGKGTGASAVIAGGATGACIEFNTKYTGGNPPLGNESARLYLKEVDANNNALAVRIFKANAYQEVEITSPKAICGECGSTDGAKDPTYDFSRSMMLVELWCGHAYEVPMTGWNMVS